MNPEQKRATENQGFINNDPTRGNESTRGSAERSQKEEGEKTVRGQQQDAQSEGTKEASKNKGAEKASGEVEKNPAGRGRLMRSLFYIGGAYILYRMGRRVFRRGNAKKNNKD